MFEPFEADRVAARERAGLELAEELKKHVSPPGSLGLPSLLDARRIEFSLPDCVFQCRPVYDRIYVAQCEERSDGKYQRDGLIFKPETAKARDLYTVPRGILVSAGLMAMDALRSNGIELGHFVRFAKLGLFRYVVDKIAGQDVEILILTAGDITGSEDLEKNIRSGRMEIMFDRDQAKHHFFDNQHGEHLSNPSKPFYGADQ